MDRGGETFPSALRIRKRRDFLQARSRGRKVHSPHFLIYAAPSNSGESRLGLTVSRKIGTAVERNRVKRLVREFFRLHYDLLLPGTDYSVIAKRGAAGLDFFTVCDELSRLHRT